MKLKTLQLYQNQLTGAIPETIGQCVELEHLILHANQLSGKVPHAALAKLTKVKQLGINQNAALTITEAGKQLIVEAVNKEAKFWWPSVVG